MLDSKRTPEFQPQHQHSIQNITGRLLLIIIFITSLFQTLFARAFRKPNTLTRNRNVLKRSTARDVKLRWSHHVFAFRVCVCCYRCDYTFTPTRNLCRLTSIENFGSLIDLHTLCDCVWDAFTPQLSQTKMFNISVILRADRARRWRECLFCLLMGEMASTLRLESICANHFLVGVERWWKIRVPLIIWRCYAMSITLQQTLCSSRTHTHIRLHSSAHK